MYVHEHWERFVENATVEQFERLVCNYRELMPEFADERISWLFGLITRR